LTQYILDPSFPLRRWEIEVSFRDMKTTLGYEFIRGRTPHIVKLDLGVLALAYNSCAMSSQGGRLQESGAE
jgi:hypothetical protein